MSVSVAVRFGATVTEILPTNTDSAADANRTVTHAAFDESFTLNAASAVPATIQAQSVMALVAGALTISLRALTGTNGAAVDGNGLKLQLLRIKNLGANAMTFAEGAVNGYALGSSLVVRPSGIAMIYFADSAPDIAAADLAIDVTGTAAQTFEFTAIMG